MTSTVSDHNSNEDLTRDEIVQGLSLMESIPEYSREYEGAVVDFIQSFAKKNRFNEILCQIMEDDQINEKIAYVAFFISCTISRRNKDFSQYKNLITDKKNQKRFEKFISFDHLKSMCFIQTIQARGDLQRAIEYGKNAIDKAELLSKEERPRVNIGFYHSYAVNVAIGFEEGYLALPKDIEYLRLAADYVNKSIAYDYDYAKFHCTLGRINIIEGQYEDALKEFRMAIDFEKSSNVDYALRINDYQNYMITAKTNINMKKINRSIIAEVEKEVEDIRSKNIQVLSFFVAILSFVIGSIQLVSSSNAFIEKAALIILLFGCLLLALGAFGRNLSGSKDQNYLFSMLVGLLMICGSLGVYFVSPFLLR